MFETLKFLRGPNGCPWDRKQSLTDLCRYLLDESYELQDSLNDGDLPETISEMGDVLFLVFMMAIVLEEQGHANLDDIAQKAREKIIRRHPHVFADESSESPEESLKHWQEIKRQEARDRGEAPGRFLDKIPRSLPPVRRALTVQRKVGSVGFEWEEAQQVFERLLEETCELDEALSVQDPKRLEDELGDMLFSIINLSRFLKVDPERALTSTVDKFTQRFHRVEEELRRAGKSLEEASLEEMDSLWEQVKRRG